MALEQGATLEGYEVVEVMGGFSASVARKRFGDDVAVVIIRKKP